MQNLRDNYLQYSMAKDQLLVNINNPQLPLGTFYEETKKQVSYVYDNKNKPLYVFLSGGLDSEFLVHVMSEMKLTFTTVICRWVGLNKEVTYNLHDIEHAFNICNKLNIKPLVYDFNIEEYVNSGEALKDVNQYLKGTFVGRIYPCVYLKIIKDLNGSVLLSGDFHSIRLDTDRKQWNFRIPRLGLVGLKIFQENNLEVCPFFLSFSSEMLFSFLLDPEIVKLCSGGYPGKIVHESLKATIYNRGNNFNLKSYDYVTRDRIKLHGWEKLFESHIWEHPDMEKIKNLTYEVWDNPKEPVAEYKEDMHLFLQNHNLR